MRIGFFMKLDKGNSFARGRNTIGEEPYFEAMVRCMRDLPGVESAEVYAPNYLPKEKLDFMVHINDTPPRGDADKDILYLQNGYRDGSDKTLVKLSKNNYDGYILLSEKLLGVLNANGLEGACIPLGADTETFHPRAPDPSLAYDVSYVGNDIKGKERTERYLMPATKFKFGLYGNWGLKPIGKMEQLLPPLRKKHYPAYRVALCKLSRGKIPQKRLPVLYSSAKINLNFTHQDAADWDFVNLRPFEIPACGGFLITDRIPSLEKEMDGGVVFTDGRDDLVSKIELYLEDEKKRKAIAKKGMDIVHERCSLKKRSTDVYNYLRSL